MRQCFLVLRNQLGTFDFWFLCGKVFKSFFLCEFQNRLGLGLWVRVQHLFYHLFDVLRVNSGVFGWFRLWCWNVGGVSFVMLLNHFFNNFFNLFNINYNSLVGRLFGFLSLISNFVNLFNNNFIIVLSSNTDSNILLIIIKILDGFLDLFNDSIIIDNDLLNDKIRWICNILNLLQYLFSLVQQRLRNCLICVVLNGNRWWSTNNYLCLICCLYDYENYLCVCRVLEH